MLYRDYLKNKYHNTAVKLANAEGVPCVLEYSKGKNMRNYEVYGNSVQDGTPTPESPVEVQSVGDLVTKNLFNKEDSHCYEIKAEPPTVININTYAAGVLWSDQLISLFKPNTTYTISCEFECVDVPSDDYTFDSGILGFLIQPKVSGYSSINMLITHQLVKGEIYHFSKTFTIPSNFSEGTYTMYVYRNSYKNSDGKIRTASVICRNIQIEEGSTATEYEPYHKYDIPITVKGKNLFDKSISINSSIRNETVNTDNSYSIGILRLNKICEILKPNITYTISCEFECESIPSDVTLSANQLGFSIYTPVSGYSTANALIKKQLSVGEIYHYSQTTTTPLKFDSGGDYRFLIYRNAYKDADGNYQFPAIICRNIQIEEGSSSTAYEPYKGSQTTHIYLDEPLRKVGDYADYIDFKNQNVVRKIEVLDDTGTKTISESFGTLSTPTEENISLPSLKTFKGTNVMSVDTSIQPSNIKAKYIRT